MKTAESFDTVKLISQTTKDRSNTLSESDFTTPTQQNLMTIQRQSISNSIKDVSLRILGELNKITGKLDEINQLERDLDLWRFASKMLDRCCLYVFSAALAIVTVMFSAELVYDHMYLNNYHH